MSIETASSPHESGPHDSKQLLADMTLAFDAFKQANDARLAALEKRQSADVLLSDKVERINDELSRLSTQAQRPALANQADPAQEAKAQFDAYLRGQAPMPTEHKASEADKLTVTGAQKTDFYVPDHVEHQLEEAMAARSALRQLASQTVLETGSDLRFVRRDDKLAAKWVGETGDREALTAPKMAEITLALHELYASPVATQRFIDDSDIDVEAWLLNEIAEAFAETENQAFISGKTSNMPEGILSKTPTYDDKRADFEVRYLKSGDAKGFAADTASRALFNTILNLHGHYRSRAAWLMNSSTQALLRSFKDEAGNYIWAPPKNIGEAPGLFGYPVYDEPHLPDVAANAVPILFGDFARGYKIVRRRHTGLMRDPYSDKPNVIFYTTRRVGGAVVNTLALRGIKVAK